MRRTFVFIASAIAGVSPAFAGGALPIGSSTFQITWAAQVPEAVPTMGTYAILMLAALLAVVVYRLTRNQGWLVKAIAPLLAFGVTASAIIGTQSSIAGLAVPPVDASDCSGSQTYTAETNSPPPCFSNTCGKPVEVSYTLIEAFDPNDNPISESECTRVYYCNENGGSSAPPALEGEAIPSDGTLLGTAYCDEIFPIGDA